MNGKVPRVSIRDVRNVKIVGMRKGRSVRTNSKVGHIDICLSFLDSGFLFLTSNCIWLLISTISIHESGRWTGMQQMREMEEFRDVL